MDYVQKYGREGERQALEYLEGRGWRLVETNYQTRWGEIDLIMLEGATLIFVEVKRRQTMKYGLPEESISPFKQRHLVKAALCYIKERRVENQLMRFDAVSVSPEGIRLIKNAFSADGMYYL